MIFRRPHPEEQLDQGDIIDGCPILGIRNFDKQDWSRIESEHAYHRVIILTQTCDLANEKASEIAVALLFDAQAMIDQGKLNRNLIRGPIRAGHVHGWYFLPKDDLLGFSESIADLRQLHTIRHDILSTLCLQGKRLARLQPLYREHLAKHFADTYSRIGLPEPYPSD